MRTALLTLWFLGSLGCAHATLPASGLAEEVDFGAGLQTMTLAVTHNPATWRPAVLTLSDAFAGAYALPLAFDLDGLPTAIGDLALTYDGSGLPTQAALGDLTTTRTFNGFGALTAQSLAHSNTPLYGFALTQDAGGRISSREACLGATCTTWSFTYDHRGRLTEAASGADFDRFTYDPNGNRLSRTRPGGVENGVYDAQDRLLTYGGATFSHNLAGQRTGITAGPHGDWTYTWDVFGNLLRAQQAGGDDIEYLVNAQGQRIGRRANGGPWTWWFYGGRLTPMAEFDDGFRLRKVFVYGVLGHVPEYMVAFDAAGVQTGRYRFVTDPIGSVIGLVDDLGQWQSRYSYSVFGEQTVELAGPAVPFGFAGGMQDTATKLVRFGAREYDPWTGRWLTKDPIDFGGGDTNLYAYVGGDPVNLVDPTGLIPSKAQAIGLGLQYLFGVDPEVGTTIAEVVAWTALEEVGMAAITGGTWTIGRWLWRLGRGGKKAKLACQLDAPINPNQLHHIFDKAEHALDDFVKASGGQEQAFRRLQAAANDALKRGELVPGPNGILPRGDAGAIIDVGGTPIRLIGGRVVNGTVHISSASRRGL